MIGYQQIVGLVNRVLEAIDADRNYKSRALLFETTDEETITVSKTVKGYGLKVFSGSITVTFSNNTSIVIDEVTELFWNSGDLADVKFQGASTPKYIVYWNER